MHQDGPVAHIVFATPVSDYFKSLSEAAFTSPNKVDNGRFGQLALEIAKYNFSNSHAQRLAVTYMLTSLGQAPLSEPEMRELATFNAHRIFPLEPETAELYVAKQLGQLSAEGMEALCRRMREFETAPAEFGKETQNALKTFGMQTGKSFAQTFPEYAHALGLIKKATVLANYAVGNIKPTQLSDGTQISAELIRDCIVTASQELALGKLDSHLVVDMLVGGAGTSHNMNVNEVIASRANTLLQRALKRTEPVSVIHYLDHVNCSQSTNDALPTAARIGVVMRHERLIEHLKDLRDAIGAHAHTDEFKKTVMVGRTHLQEAVPILASQIFEGYATAINRRIRRLEQMLPDLAVCTLGDTAVGTGINTHPKFRETVQQILNDSLKEAGVKTEFRAPESTFCTTNSLGDLETYHAGLVSVMAEASRFASDLRLYASGPRSGFAEIGLPTCAKGSSIMPGKVNPILPEDVNQMFFLMAGHQVSLLFAASNGQMQLNVMGPSALLVVAQSTRMMLEGIPRFTSHCVSGLKLRQQNIEKNVEYSFIASTALNLELGYENAALVVQEAFESGRTLRQVLTDEAFMRDKLQKEILANDILDFVLDVRSLTEPRMHGIPNFVPA